MREGGRFGARVIQLHSSETKAFDEARVSYGPEAVSYLRCFDTHYVGTSTHCCTLHCAPAMPRMVILRAPEMPNSGRRWSPDESPGHSTLFTLLWALFILLGGAFYT